MHKMKSKMQKLKDEIKKKYLTTPQHNHQVNEFLNFDNTHVF